MSDATGPLLPKPIADLGSVSALDVQRVSRGMTLSLSETLHNFLARLQPCKRRLCKQVVIRHADVEEATIRDKSIESDAL